MNLYLSARQDFERFFMVRDHGMFLNTLSAVSRQSSAVSFVVVGHLAHLVYDSTSIQSTARFLLGGDVLGTHLRKHFGAAYQLVAVSAPEISFVEKNQEKKVLMTKDSIEQLLPADIIFRMTENDFRQGLTISSCSDQSATDMAPCLQFKSAQFDYLYLCEAAQR
jgi:Erythromycin esterase